MAKSDRILLLFGALAAAAFVLSTGVLGALLPHYDPVSQTISEIGERGSPFEVAFRVGELSVTACLALFVWGLARFSLGTRRSLVPALMLGSYVAANLGIAIFESPHPLHNVFGISMTLGFFTPLILPLCWRDDPEVRLIRRASILVGLWLTLGIAVNLSPLFVDYAPGNFVRANYGVIQRLVLIPFHLWCGFLALALLARPLRACT